MKCPKCKSRMYVKATVPIADDITCRTYYCEKCGWTDISKETFPERKESKEYAERR